MAADREAVRRQGESLSPDLQAPASAVSACPSPQSTAADGADFSVERLERVILHMIAHCLLGHVWMEREGAAFDLACDVQAWLLAEELAPETALSGDAQELRRRLRGAETLAQTREILESDSFVREHREELSKRIALDAHDLWGRTPPEALVASGELRGLKGALFFSDGRGIFPSVPPEYEATFVFLKHRFDAIDVPGWVRRLVVDAPPPAGGEYFEY